MGELDKTLEGLTTRERIEQAILAGAPYIRVKDQHALADLLGTSYSNIRRILLSMELVGRKARKLGVDPRTIRKRIQTFVEERAAQGAASESQNSPNGATRAPQELQAAEKYVTQVALDARDPVQRLELYNALATNQRGDIPPAVQVAALSKISDESKQAGEAFGIPGPSNDEEETTRVLAVLQSAQLHCALAAIKQFQEAQCTPSDSTLTTSPVECANGSGSESASKTPLPKPQEPSTTDGSGTPGWRDETLTTTTGNGCSASQPLHGDAQSGTENPSELSLESTPSHEPSQPESASAEEIQTPQAPSTDESIGDAPPSGGVD